LNLGAKTIVYALDGLDCARRHISSPLHHPNPPLFSRVQPKTDWPASLRAWLDGVAIDSVGLDMLDSQRKNNLDENGHPRIMMQENADDYLMEEALAENPPSGGQYRQDGEPVKSPGVFEHWNREQTRQYSRNKGPKHGRGIELLYLPVSS
jgi:hypothetical protein